MLRSMITASNTMNELQKQMNNISHNLANLDTAGYKAKNTSFSELVRQQIEQVNEKNNEVAQSRKTPPGLRLGVGAVMTEKLTHSQGSVKETGRKLDIALTSPYQYFQVDVDGEVQYTRDGTFELTPAAGNANQLQLATKDGHPVLDENGNAIRFDRRYQNFQVDKNGTITVSSGQGGASLRFNLGIVRAVKPQALIEEGSNLFSVDDNLRATALINLTGAGRQDISMKQGFLEASNVDVSKEMTDLIASQRSYQMNSRAVTMGDQMMGLINSVR
ncbi:flagellar hook-basal body protein [Bacillus sonorensis]|uniref:flagellar hook-basal body protein n=1 Tax=Bacillus TaxID=1386 RepID=UPI0018CE1917|nr:flagellar hook-basal body protein [Bacillus sonorensis]MBG9914884.1 flagellar hook-basal body protein FlhP [Bacillus sonorensis]MCY8089279.1 flagellar hook-basal body protein [Bacillus sonorensis]MCY8270141.1 flagellar hook-basal body protein [Bacillus sonorensis]MCY8402900.1 flagellar hook-basal body protein [Bacillus sonorensis]MCY8605075.1 flagellar hook-basal body protein [Bacillus sonorensis]